MITNAQIHTLVRLSPTGLPLVPKPEAETVKRRRGDGVSSVMDRLHHQCVLVFSSGYCCAVLPCLTLIILVWAVRHSGRMCSSLRNSLVLLAGEGGPAVTANKGTTHTHACTHIHTHTHTLQGRNMHCVNKPLRAFQRVNLNRGRISAFDEYAH